MYVSENTWSWKG